MTSAVQILTTKTQYNGLMGYRDYLVQGAVASGNDILIRWPGGERYIQHKDIEKQIADVPPARVPFMSKFDRKVYHLVYFYK